MSSIEFVRTEIERLRVQISRQQQDIVTLQRLGLSTGLAEELLARMRASINALCAKRDWMQREERVAAIG
jgi:hypothetical protein